jgi:PleD family two-component response regulator
MHDGKISVHSTGSGEGTTFRVQLPAVKRPAKGAAAAPGLHQGHELTAEASSLRLLVVEDHQPTLEVLRRLLERAGHSVITASTLASARELARGATLDLVLSDIGLPDG